LKNFLAWWLLTLFGKPLYTQESKGRIF
jgi:hypothetical protein